MLRALALVVIGALTFAGPLRAFTWEQATANGRDYVTLRSFCAFYSMPYEAALQNGGANLRNAQHSIRMKLGSSDAYIDGVHYVLSFPIEGGDRDLLVSRMDVIKLFEPIMRPTQISGRHTIRGVVIDPGHGGADNGAASRLGYEKNYTLDTAFRLEKVLNSMGLRTVLTRRTDVFIDLYERAHIASLYPDYCFVSLHYNSADAAARGLETYCVSPRGAASTSSNYLTRADIYKLPGNDYDSQNVLLASCVHSSIIRTNPGDATADRGVKRARFVVIKQNVLPAILVEGGFVSNRLEASAINTPNYRQRLAEAVARGVGQFAGIMGNSHFSFFDSSDNEVAMAPPSVPDAPSGLAREVVARRALPVVVPVSPKGTSGQVAVKKKKSSKKRLIAAKANPIAPSPASSAAPAAATNPAVPTPAISPNAPVVATAKPLDLAEPKPPALTPGPIGKESAEPDEPPTVNAVGAAPPTNGPSAVPPVASTSPSPASGKTGKP